ncbi:MAG: ABC transporter ATP-binding protein [Rikenellaceae bacterium]|nr:ABC transporter ATP-binding protein [Rikenellaceae bacterium]MBR4055214.1 ABC transporter ATP-binding protein [Rikenellaceae bacterium]
MIRLENISLGYGTRTLLEGVTTHFEAGTLTALIGRNGAGKSTLLRALAGLEPLQAGAITIGGQSIAELDGAEAARRVAFVATDKVRIANLPCEDLVALGRAPYTNWIGRLQAVDREIVADALAKVGMSEFAHKTMDRMSDGECQRVMIARALAQQTPVILLDEPTAFLDMPNRYELCRLLQRLAHDEQKVILFSTHELDIATKMCDAIALIDTPQLLHQPASEMVAGGAIERLFGI